MEGGRRERESTHTRHPWSGAFQPPSEAAELVLEHGAVLERIAACLLVRGCCCCSGARPGPQSFADPPTRRRHRVVLGQGRGPTSSPSPSSSSDSRQSSPSPSSLAPARTGGEERRGGRVERKEGRKEEDGGERMCSERGSVSDETVRVVI